MAVRTVLSICLFHLAGPQPLWEVCWGEEGRTGDCEGVVGEVLGTRVGLGRLFSSLEGSIHSLCPRWDGALPGRCCSLSGQPGEVPHCVVKVSLGNLTAQPHWVSSDLLWAHCMCILTCFGLAACAFPSSIMAHLGPPGTPDLLAGPRLAFLACAALTAQHPGHPASLPFGLQGVPGALGILAAQYPCLLRALLPDGASALTELGLCRDAQGSPQLHWAPRSPKEDP